MERKKDYRRRWSAEHMSGRDTAVLCGEEMATVYGCRRILRYAPSRICLERAHGRVCVWGEGLICTAFSVGCVTVEGRIDGLRYCRDECEKCAEGEEL